MQVREQIVASRAKTSGSGNPNTTVTIHMTGNTGRGANAAAHANLQSKGNVRNASWHETVDDKEAVISFPPTVKCWHAGTAKGNNNSYAIEICVNSDGDYVQAVRNGAIRAAARLRATGRGVEALRQHHDWTGKNCPTQLRAGNHGITWGTFKLWVAAELAGVPAPAPTPARPSPAPSGALSVDGKWGPATTRALQARFGTTQDEVISHQWKSRHNENIYSAQFDRTKIGSNLIRAMQGWLSLPQDGLCGPATITALQRRLGTTPDGVISSPSSVVKEMQRRLNTQSL